MDHQQQFKNNNKPEEMRQRRLDAVNEMRGTNREAELDRNRQMLYNEIMVEAQPPVLGAFNTCSITVNKHVQNNDMMSAVKVIKALLSIVKVPPIEVINFIPVLVGCFSNPDVSVQAEALAVVLNMLIQFPMLSAHVVNANAMLPLLQLFGSTDENILEHVRQLIGHIACVSQRFHCDIYINEILSPLVDALQLTTPLSILRNITWIFAILSHTKCMCLDSLTKVLAGISNIITCEDLELICHIASIIEISARCSGHNKAIIDSGVLAIVVSWLKHPCDSIRLSTISAFIAVGGSTTEFLMILIDLKVATFILEDDLSPDGNLNIQLHILRLLVDLTSVVGPGVDAMIDPNILTFVLRHFFTGIPQMQELAVYTLVNLTSSGIPEHSSRIINETVVKKLCTFLSNDFLELSYAVLMGLAQLIENFNDDAPDIAEYIKSSGKYEMIVQFKEHLNRNLSTEATKVIRKITELDMEIAGITPKTNEGKFVFDCNDFEPFDF